MLADLSLPENVAEDATSIECEQTHGSLVFLTPTEVFKLKRAVDFGFFDFTTLAARLADCEAEVALNRRLAPDVYREVVPVFQDAIGYSLTRPGEIVDYAVRMRRLPLRARADDLLRRDELTGVALDGLARYVAAFYRRSPRLPPAASDVRANFEENFDQVRPFAGDILELEEFESLRDRQQQWLREKSDWISARPTVDGHGDLRLEHVYFLDHGPTAIDCIEFLDRFRIADPALDVSFFAMELYREGRADLAETFLASFAYESNDYDAYPLFDGYMSYRAFVRAKVAAFVASDANADTERRERKRAEARRQFALAAQLLEPRSVGRVVAVGGLPASGKSTVGRMLRPIVRGPIVSADAARKFLAGAEPTDRLGSDAYSEDFSARVLNELIRRADRALASGRSVVFDTTFRSSGAMQRVREFAERHGAKFSFVECVAPESVLRERLRNRTGDVSDADESVLDWFLNRSDACCDTESMDVVRLDTTLPAAEMHALLRDHLEE